LRGSWEERGKQVIGERRVREWGRVFKLGISTMSIAIGTTKITI
jgi:hypothetical protein